MSTRTETTVASLVGKPNRQIRGFDEHMRAHVEYRREREGDNPKTLRSVFGQALDYSIHRGVNIPGFVAGRQSRFMQMVEEVGLETPENKSKTLAEAIDRHGTNILQVGEHLALQTSTLDKLFFYGTLLIHTMPEDFDRSRLVEGQLPEGTPSTHSEELFRRALIELREESDLGEFEVERDGYKDLTDFEVALETAQTKILLQRAASHASNRFLRVVAESGIAKADIIDELDQAAETEPAGFSSVTELFQTVLRGTRTENQYHGTVDYLNRMHDRSLEVFREKGITGENGPYTSIVDALDDDALERLNAANTENGINTFTELGPEQNVYLAMIQALINVSEKRFLGAPVNEDADLPPGIAQLEIYADVSMPLSTLEREEELINRKRERIKHAKLDPSQRSILVNELKKDKARLEQDRIFRDSSYIAGQFLDVIQTISFTAVNARDEINVLFNEYSAQKAFEENWYPFMVEPTGERMVNKAGATKATTEKKDGSETLVYEDNPRIRFLNELLRLWNIPREEYYKHWFTSRFKGVPARSQYVAITLPALDENGDQLYDKDGKTPLFHAVVESPDRENAVFVWRAESGRQVGGWHTTWKSVFARQEKIGKREASQISGVRRIVHTGDWEARVLDYLVRPESDLGRSDYKGATTTDPKVIEVYNHLMATNVA